MLIQFLISLLFVAGLSTLLGCFVYFLTKTAIDKPSFKDDWVTVGEYKLFSVKEKIKYHKYRGKSAEHIELKRPLIFLVYSKYTSIYCDYKFFKKEDEYFYLDKHAKFYAEHPEFKLEYDFKNICAKLSDGSELKLSVDPKLDSVRIILNDENAGFIIGFDNVIEWYNESSKNEILNVIRKLEQEEMKALIAN